MEFLKKYVANMEQIAKKLRKSSIYEVALKLCSEPVGHTGFSSEIFIVTFTYLQNKLETIVDVDTL